MFCVFGLSDLLDSISEVVGITGGFSAVLHVIIMHMMYTH